tara:strand:- start:294 stop:1148 length:855 start_codon:yes stop_codon:yes gene_type:complete
MDIQILFVKWGRKYSHDYLNLLMQKIQEKSQHNLEFICITEDSFGITKKINSKKFPSFSVPMDTLLNSGGCKPKLSVFCKGLNIENTPTIYIDLDTMVLGDIGKIAKLQENQSSLHGLPNHFIPHWRFPWLSWATPEKCFFINSSILSFYPRNHEDIFEDFNEAIKIPEFLDNDHPNTPWHMKSDERYISMHEKGKLRALPRILTGSFQDLYLTPFLWLSKIQDQASHVIRRRTNRVALTFHGENFKPAKMARLEVGDIVSNGPLKTRWAYPQFSEYWREFERK